MLKAEGTASKNDSVHAKTAGALKAPAVCAELFKMIFSLLLLYAHEVCKVVCFLYEHMMRKDSCFFMSI